jgi:hypothetical protein
MALKQKRKVNRKIICGKGYCTCQNKKYVHGKGIMDVFNSVKNIVAPAMNLIKDNTDTLKNTAEAIGNVVKIGDSTKTIVQEIMKKRRRNVQNSSQEDTLQNIVDKINQFKMGSGFAYI